jgi:hypothetical protein
MSDADKRKRLKAHYAACDAVRAERDVIGRAEYEQFVQDFTLPPRRGWSQAPQAIPTRSAGNGGKDGNGA